MSGIEFKSGLIPIVVRLENGRRFGLCHYCESEITPGEIFCRTDKTDKENPCESMWIQKNLKNKAVKNG